MNLLDDDSENDSDYVPEEDPDYIPGPIENQQISRLQEIGFGRKRKAQALWEELQSEDQQFLHSVLSNAVSYNSSYYNVEKPIQRTARQLKVFFHGKAAKGKTSKKRSRESDDEEDENLESGQDESRQDEKLSGLREKAKEIIAQVKKKVRVEEVRKFAGEAVVVEKVVLQSQLDQESLQKQQQKKTSIDKALEMMKGPKAVNTVQKSSSDWDQYKEKEGIQDELETGAAKNAFIERKEFLERCDYRNFETERDERLKRMANR